MRKNIYTAKLIWAFLGTMLFLIGLPLLGGKAMVLPAKAMVSNFEDGKTVVVSTSLVKFSGQNVVSQIQPLDELEKLVPARLAKWFAQDASKAILSFAGEAFPNVAKTKIKDFKFGVPRNGYRVNPQWLDRKVNDPMALPTNIWVASVILDKKVIGVVLVDNSDTNGITIKAVKAEVQLGSALTNRDFKDLFLVEGDSWYVIEGQEVAPVSSKAKDNLAGNVPLDVFRSVWSAGEQQRMNLSQNDEAWYGNPVVLAALAVGIIIVLVGILVWWRADKSKLFIDQP